MVPFVGAGVVAGGSRSGSTCVKMLDEKIGQAKVSLARGCTGPRPKGVEALGQMQLRSEVLDWHSCSNRRKIACLSRDGARSEWSTGQKERRGSITKVGVPAIRRDHCGDGLADGLISAPVSTGPKMAGESCEAVIRP